MILVLRRDVHDHSGLHSKFPHSLSSPRTSSLCTYSILHGRHSELTEKSSLVSLYLYSHHFVLMMMHHITPILILWHDVSRNKDVLWDFLLVAHAVLEGSHRWVEGKSYSTPILACVPIYLPFYIRGCSVETTV
jgi:hypothetical protein